MSVEQPVYRVRSTGSRGGKWIVCPGTGTEPATIVQPERRRKDGTVTRQLGVCRRCRRVVAAPGGLLMNHAPYDTRR